MQLTSRVSHALLPFITLAALAALAACEPSSSPSSVDPPIKASQPFMPPTATPTGTTTPGGTMTAPPSAKTWGPAVELSDAESTSFRGDPVVGIDATGSAIAAWRETLSDNTRNVVMASRLAAGRAWSKPMTIDNPIGNSGSPQLAIAPNGTALATFTQSASNQGGEQYLVTSRFSGTWGAPMTMSTPGLTPEDPFVALGDDGAATVVFRAADDTYPRAWAASSSTSGVFSAPAVMKSNAQPGLHPSVTVAPSGDAVMTWSESAGPSTTSLWATRRHEGTWSAPVRLSADSGQVLNEVLLGTDSSGDVLALWAQRVGEVGAPYTLESARMSATTGTWSTPLTVNDGTREVTGPRLSVDAAGDATAVWYETSYGVVASHFSPTTSTWAAPVLLQAIAGAVSFPSPTVGIDAKGNAVATWVRAIGTSPVPSLFAAHYSSDGAAWSAPIDLLTDPSATPFPAETQVSVNASGEAIVVWRQDAGPTSTPGIWARIYR